MDKNRVKKGLINAAPFIGAAGVQVPFMLEGDWVNAILFLTNLSVSWMFYKSGVVKYDREAFVKSPICQEYLGLYDEFVSDVAKMYEELGIDPGLGSAVAFRFCLESGFFSKDKTDKYSLFENDNDKFIAFLGGRVTTGRHCCRHSASLFSDINNKMKKGLSPKISVYLDNDFKRDFKLKPNHLVSGLVHKNKKLLFDSTTVFTNIFADGIAFIKDGRVMGRNVAENVTGSRFTFASDGYDNRRILNTDMYDQFMALESVANENELFDDFMEAVLTVSQNVKDFSDFHEEEKPKILQLANLNTIISPHGKEIVKEK